VTDAENEKGKENEVMMKDVEEMMEENGTGTGHAIKITPRVMTITVIVSTIENAAITEMKDKEAIATILLTAPMTVSMKAGEEITDTTLTTFLL